jgi:hypothetical protein
MSIKSKARKASLQLQPKKSRSISGATSRKVKVETRNARVATKRAALSPSQPHSKTYGH